MLLALMRYTPGALVASAALVACPFESGHPAASRVPPQKHRPARVRCLPERENRLEVKPLGLGPLDPAPIPPGPVLGPGPVAWMIHSSDGVTIRAVVLVWKALWLVGCECNKNAPLVGGQQGVRSS